MLPWPSEIEPVADHQAKGQWVRLADVFVIGPMMSYFAVKATSEPMWLRSIMFAFGVGTVIYNGRNYLAVRRYMQQQREREREQNGAPGEQQQPEGQQQAEQQAVQGMYETRQHGLPWYQEPLVYYPADFAPTDRPSAIFPPPEIRWE